MSWHLGGEAWGRGFTFWSRRAPRDCRRCTETCMPVAMSTIVVGDSDLRCDHIQGGAWLWPPALVPASLLSVSTKPGLGVLSVRPAPQQPLQLIRIGSQVYLVQLPHVTEHCRKVTWMPQRREHKYCSPGLLTPWCSAFQHFPFRAHSFSKC